MSMASNHALPLGGNDVSFDIPPLADLHFAFGWARLAPGQAVWKTRVFNISSGEMIEVSPPGSEHADFLVFS